MSALEIYSGEAPMGVVGTEVGAFDCTEKLLHVGDIVHIWSVDYAGTDLEVWRPNGLTVVVWPAPGVFSGDGGGPFVMGIRDCKFDHPDWRIQLVKSGQHAIEGEHWPDYGFNYRRARATGSDTPAASTRESGKEEA